MLDAGDRCGNRADALRRGISDEDARHARRAGASSSADASRIVRREANGEARYLYADPDVATVQTARVIGGRVYILLLIGDADGERMLEKLSAAAAGTQ